MSVGHENVGVMELLRSLDRRLKRLESKDKSVKQNDVRLGNLVVTTDPVTNQVCIENLDTKEVVCFGADKPIEWSYSGTLNVVGGLDSDGDGFADVNNAPPWRAHVNAWANEIMLALVKPASGDVSILMHWPNGNVIGYTLPAGEKFISFPLHMYFPKNSQAYPTLAQDGTDATDLTVMVRFGQPAEPESI